MPTVAEASFSEPYPDNWGQYHQNNVTGTFSSDVDTAINWGVNEWEGKGTTSGGPAFHFYSGSGDIYNYIGYRSNAAVTTCHVYVSIFSDRCDSFHISYNETVWAHGDVNGWKNLGCHEFGHTLGLDERPNTAATCMNRVTTNSGSRLAPDVADQNDVGVVSYLMNIGFI